MSEPGTTETVDDVVHHEPARSYRSMIATLLVFGALFVLDIVLEGEHGAFVHLPGWLGAAVVLLGVHGVLIYAVRATHSLTLSADELAVGDEVIARDVIVGVTVGGGAGDDLPTLGWPNGFPRGSKGVTLRLVDGRDVLVPSRAPARLQEALAVGAPAPEAELEIRVADEADLAELPDVDERAEAIFRVTGHRLPRLPLDEQALAAARLVLVVGEPVAGFAWVDEVDGAAHLCELSVLPSAMRRGHGTRLLEAACTWAAGQGFDAVTLTTFDEIPWNAPFYAARGFSVVTDPGPGLRALREHERAAGLDAVGPRVVMRRPLTPV